MCIMVDDASLSVLIAEINKRLKLGKVTSAVRVGGLREHVSVSVRVRVINAGRFTINNGITSGESPMVSRPLDVRMEIDEALICEYDRIANKINGKVEEMLREM